MSKRHYQVLKPSISSKEKRYVNDCLDTGWIGAWGKYIGKFERAFAEFSGMKHARTTANGTVSLHLILLALGIGKGDEVIVPNFTYIASANAVKYAGAKPVFADCEADTFNIDPQDIEARITPRTKAIMVVHVYGNPCRMDEIGKIARRHSLPIIEDAAQAHGAHYRGRKLGSFGVANSFSFFGSKTIATGEGGMVVTGSDKIIKSIELLKNQGQGPGRKYYHPVMGYNYRMTNIQAAIGLAQLERVGSFLKRKAIINGWYRKYLGDLVTKGIVKFQRETPGGHSSWWVTTCTFDGVSIAKLGDELRLGKIETRPFFVPMNEIPHLRQSGVFPASQRISERGIILPSSVDLAERDVSHIAGEIKKIILAGRSAV